VIRGDGTGMVVALRNEDALKLHGRRRRVERVVIATAGRAMA